MIVDASALLAVVLAEPDAARYADAMTDAEHLRISAPSWFEASLIVDRRGDTLARSRFDEFARTFEVSIEPFTAAHAIAARQAWREYGRGSRHPAKLTFGDCLAYGFAKVEGEPLLYKGDDFPHTDIRPALPAGPAA